MCSCPSILHTTAQSRSPVRSNASNSFGQNQVNGWSWNTDDEVFFRPIRLAAFVMYSQATEARYLLRNLVKEGQSYRWKINLQVWPMLLVNNEKDTPQRTVASTGFPLDFCSSIQWTCIIYWWQRLSQAASWAPSICNELLLSSYYQDAAWRTFHLRTPTNCSGIADGQVLEWWNIGLSLHGFLWWVRICWGTKELLS